MSKLKQVVFLMVDTQRTDMISCYSKTNLHTPNLDKLASESTMYTNAYTCQPVCGPARSALFTGLYPHSNGMVANCMQLGQNVKNIGEWLTPHDIECGYIGKWHLDGGDYFGYGKCPNGFNPKYWYDMRNFLDEMNDDDRKLSRKNMSIRRDNPKEEDTYAHKCIDKGIAFLEEFKDKDFFLTVSLDEPHDPSICPRKYMRQRYCFKKTPNVKASLKGKPSHHVVWSKLAKGLPFSFMKAGMKCLFACNSYCDYEFGRLFKKIEDLGIQPMIIYTSDHGDMLLSHNLLGKGCVMYNEITKIPLFIKGEGFDKKIENTPVSHIDLAPTVMKYLEVPIPKMMQGEPLQDIKHNQKRDIHIEFTRYEVDHDGFMGYQPIRCIYDGEYKLVINLLSTDELYNLKNDPYEMKNLIMSEDPEIVSIRNQLHDRLLEHMNTTRDVYRGYYWATRPYRKDKVASFRNDGYTRQLQEEDFVQLDYSTGLPMKSHTRKK